MGFHGVPFSPSYASLEARNQVYRREFETHLPGSFEHFHHLFKGPI